MICFLGSGLNESSVKTNDFEEWNALEVDENPSNRKLYSGDGISRSLDEEARKNSLDEEIRKHSRSLDEEMKKILVQGRQSKENNGKEVKIFPGIEKVEVA